MNKKLKRYKKEPIPQYGLGSIIGTVAGAALAPFTGGTSLAIGSALGGGADQLFGSNQPTQVQPPPQLNINPVNTQQFYNPVKAYGGYMYPFGGQMQPNAEVEGNEVIQHDPNAPPQAMGQGNMQQIASDMSVAQGPSHAQGGVPVQAQPGSMVVSDRMPAPNTKEYRSIANKVEQLGRKKGQLEKKLAKQPNDEPVKNALELTQKQIDTLIQQQEEMKQANAEAIMQRAQVRAYGGLIEYGEGGSIHINPANKGKFNATKERTSKTTEELTHSKNPLTRKRAIFAQNAAKWHHAYGGEIEQYSGGGNINKNRRYKGHNNANVIPPAQLQMSTDVNSAYNDNAVNLGVAPSPSYGDNLYVGMKPSITAGDNYSGFNFGLPIGTMGRGFKAEVEPTLHAGINRGDLAIEGDVTGRAGMQYNRGASNIGAYGRTNFNGGSEVGGFWNQALGNDWQLRTSAGYGNQGATGNFGIAKKLGRGGMIESTPLDPDYAKVNYIPRFDGGGYTYNPMWNKETNLVNQFTLEQDANNMNANLNEMGLNNTKQFNLTPSRLQETRNTIGKPVGTVVEDSLLNDRKSKTPLMKGNFMQGAQYAAQYLPDIMQLFQKTDTPMNPSDYMVKQRITPARYDTSAEEAAIMDARNQLMLQAKEMSGGDAGLYSNLGNAAISGGYKNLSQVYGKAQNINAQNQMQADQANAGIESGNMNMALQISNANAADAQTVQSNKMNALQGLGNKMSASYSQKQQFNLLKSMFPHYTWTENGPIDFNGKPVSQEKLTTMWQQAAMMLGIGKGGNV